MAGARIVAANGLGLERRRDGCARRIGAQLAALKRGQVDGVVLSASQGYGLEKTGDGRLLLKFGTYIKNFHTHVIFATDAMIANKPDQVRRFLAGWKETIAFMAANKAETVRTTRQVTGLDETIENREYDDVMPMMSRDLRFHAKALDVIGDCVPGNGDHAGQARYAHTVYGRVFERPVRWAKARAPCPHRRAAQRGLRSAHPTNSLQLEIHCHAVDVIARAVRHDRLAARRAKVSEIENSNRHGRYCR